MLKRILFILILILIIPDIYIYRMFISPSKISSLIKLIYWLPTVFILAGICYFSFFARPEGHGGLFGWFAIILFFFALPKLVFMLCSLIGLPFNYFLDWPKAPFTYIGLTLAVLVAGITAYGSLVGRSKFDIKDIAYSSARIPAGFNGYRIVQLSDLHMGSWNNDTNAVQRMVDMVNAQQPDLILFTGDLVNNRADELDKFQSILSKLHAKDGIYSVLGNHDYGSYYPWNSKQEQANNLISLKERQAAMGWKLLDNQHVILHHNNDSIALIGVENDGEPPFSQHADLPKATQDTDNMFQLLMSHNPTHWRREVLPQSNIDLMLAGHTHAMQLAFGKYSFASLRYREWGGMYTEGGRGLYVNVGTGHIGIPFRFGAWPEITLITLRN